MGSTRSLSHSYQVTATIHPSAGEPRAGAEQWEGGRWRSRTHEERESVETEEHKRQHRRQHRPVMTCAAVCTPGSKGTPKSIINIRVYNVVAGLSLFLPSPVLSSMCHGRMPLRALNLLGSILLCLAISVNVCLSALSGHRAPSLTRSICYM